MALQLEPTSERIANWCNWCWCNNNFYGNHLSQDLEKFCLYSIQYARVATLECDSKRGSLCLRFSLCGLVFCADGNGDDIELVWLRSCAASSSSQHLSSAKRELRMKKASGQACEHRVETNCNHHQHVWWGTQVVRWQGSTRAKLKADCDDKTEGKTQLLFYSPHNNIGIVPRYV